MTTASTEPAGTRRPRTNPLRALSLLIEPIARPLAGSRWLPLWAVLQHTGRTSGKAYRTPVVTFRTDRGFVIPLPFSDQTQWAKNLLASGTGSLRWKGRTGRSAARRSSRRPPRGRRSADLRPSRRASSGSTIRPGRGRLSGRRAALLKRRIAPYIIDVGVVKSSPFWYST
jgi:deazaflavin-dependent oxidoreductase (nitroreductase family)